MMNGFLVVATFFIVPLAHATTSVRTSKTVPHDQIVLFASEMRRIQESLLICVGEKEDTEMPMTFEDAILIARNHEIFFSLFKGRDANDLFLDPWRQELLFIWINGEYSAIATAGPNGIWQHGQDDDIIVPIYSDNVIWGDYYKDRRKFPIWLIILNMLTGVPGAGILIILVIVFIYRHYRYSNRC